MTAIVLPYVIGAFVLAFALAGWRLLRGPGAPDRILALDTLYTNSLALLVLVGIAFETALYFEAALVIAMLGFVGTVAMAKYIIRGDIIEDPSAERTAPGARDPEGAGGRS
jgi:multicomponent K+:H+ antiporter subunit F